MKNLFAYGTLMCEDIMHEVSGSITASQPGVIRGYTRRPVRGEQYPGLVPDAKGRVEGIVYRKVRGRVWDRLDRFEGELYARIMVRVELEDETILRAGTYVVKPKFRSRLGNANWNFAEFLRNGKTRFRRLYKGYDRKRR